jgi:hypothetical protein
MNRKLIAERCRAGGLTIHAMAYQMFVDPWVFFGSPDERSDDRMPLGVVRFLSRLLDVSIDELVDGGTEPPEVPEDDVRVEAALATLPQGMARDDLARVFGWRLDRVERALSTLDRRLRPSGRSLRRLGFNCFALGPDLSVLSPHEHEQLGQAQSRTHSLPEHEAATLLQIVRGCLPETYAAGGAAWDDVQILLARRLICLRDGAPTPAPEVVFSLRLEGQ